MYMKRKVALLFVVSALMFGTLAGSAVAQTRFTLGKILTGLQTRGTTPETNTLAKRNQYILKRVQQYGVTFRVTPEIESELVNAGATPALIAAIKANGPTIDTPPPISAINYTVNNVWVDYNITRDGSKGMLLHVDFEVSGLKGVDSKMRVRVQKAAGDFLMSDGTNSNSDGELQFEFSMKPGYETTAYKDATVFIPYSEIVLPKGKYSLKLDIDLCYEDDTLIEHMRFHDFEFTSGGSTIDTPPESNITAKVNRIWIDYNITQGGKRGMLIHVNFEVTGLQGVDSRLTARVRKKDGEFLESSSALSNDEGQLQVAFEMKPGYPTTVYKDATMFLPYSEIIIGKGAWDLELDIDLQYEDGTLIDHLEFYEFQFTRN